MASSALSWRFHSTSCWWLWSCGTISAEMYARIAEIESEVQEVAGYTFNPGSTQQLGRFLYDDLGLASGRKTKTGRSTDADTL